MSLCVCEREREERENRKRETVLILTPKIFGSEREEGSQFLIKKVTPREKHMHRRKRRKSRLKGL